MAEETPPPAGANDALGRKPRTLTVAGREYRILDLSLADLGDLQTWIDSRFPDPLDTVKPHLAGFPLEVQKFLAREAREAACRPRPQLGQAEANTQLLSVEGIKEVLYLSIRKGDPAFTRDDAAELFGKISFDQAYLGLRATGLMGGGSGGSGEDDSSPLS